MRTLPPSLGVASELDPVGRVVLEFEEAWRSGPPPLERFRDRLGADDAGDGLAELALTDLRNRLGRGEDASARDYFDRYPELAARGGRALSLIYEEYCLRVENGEAVDPSEFCQGYPTWRDSIASQLAYHRDLSRAVEPSEPDDAPPAPAPGDRFGEFELVEELGRGGTARVFLARSVNLAGRPFALKVSRDRGGEPAILGKLDHPNIVPVVASVVDPATGLRGLCMPYRPGLSLDGLIRRLRRAGPPPRHARDLRAPVDSEAAARDGDRDGTAPGWSDFPARGPYADAVAWVGLKVAQALAHAHARGFVHRDVKPENVLLNGRDGPQLIDFNLAHDPDLAEEVLSAHRGGTLPYMAREQLAAFLDPARWGEVDGRADLFSLGLVLRELLTLRPPARPSDHLTLPRAVAAMVRSRDAGPAPIRGENPRVPHALEAIVARCLAAEPAARYASAAELAADLALYLGRRPLLYAPNPSRVEVIGNALRRNRAPLAAAAAAVAVAVPCFWLLAESHGGKDNAAPRPAIEALDQAAAAEAEGQDSEAAARVDGVMAKYGGAGNAFRAALRRHPDSIVLHLGLARVLEKEQWLDEAEGEYLAVLGRDPGRVAAMVGLGNVARFRGRHAEAVAWYTRAVDRLEAARTGRASNEMLPTCRNCRGEERIALGDAAYDAGRFDEAARHFQGALDDFSSVDPVHQKDGKPRKPDGKPLASLALVREHYSAMALLGLGRSALKSGRPDWAAEQLKLALEHATEACKYRKAEGELKAKVEEALGEALRATSPTLSAQAR